MIRKFAKATIVMALFFSAFYLIACEVNASISDFILIKIIGAGVGYCAIKLGKAWGIDDMLGEYNEEYDS